MAASKAALACATVTPGFKRPSTGNISALPPLISMTCGVHASVRAGKSKPAGMTPTTVRRTAFSVTSFPMISGIRTETAAP